MQLNSHIHSINGLDFHLLEAGPATGPLVILLHGFPDFSEGWKQQIEPLASQGFHVIALDQRGYNLSSKPIAIKAYDLENLACDVVALADFFGAKTFSVVGHDWGGIVAWWLGVSYPSRIDGLVVLNAPHPDVFPRYLRVHPRQMMKSTYAAFFQLPFLPEFVLKARQFALLKRALTSSTQPGTFSNEELDDYIQAWKHPGALTAMLNYYRALARRPWGRLSKVKPPTLLIWGVQDAFLEVGLAKASLKLCENGHSLFLSTAGHWVQREEVGAVNAALLQFFSDVHDGVL